MHTLEIPETEKATLETLIVDTILNWLDTNGFEDAMSEREFLDLLDKITYKGKKVSDMLGLISYEADDGHGLRGNNEVVKVVSDFLEDPETHTKTIYNQISFSAEIEGFTLPFEIEVGDDLVKTLKSLAESAPSLSELLKGNRTDGVTLWAMDSSKLTFSVNDNGDYIVNFTEDKNIEKDGQTCNLVRTIVLKFDSSKSVLKDVTVTAKENYA
jgi:hypothetical protein